MNLKMNVNNWKYFYISRDLENNKKGLFNIESCKCSCANNLVNGDDINYIGAKKRDNGVMKRVKLVPELVTKGNGVLFICDGEGSVGYTNYIDKDFIGSTTVSIGYDENLNKYNALFIVTVLDKEKFKYSFGRKYRKNIDKVQIKLPVCEDENGIVIDKLSKYSDEGYIPDFKYMEDYIKSLDFQYIKTNNKSVVVKKLNVSDWREFKIDSLFEIYKGKRLKEEDREKGSLGYYSASESNNGLTDYISNPLFIDENALIYTTFGDCFYVPNKFTASDEVSIWKYKDIDVYNALFIVTVINQNRYKYAYGRKAYKNKYENEKIKLPICYEKDGKTPIIDKSCIYSEEGYIPDFEFMKNYITSLPYGDRLFVKQAEQNRTEQNRTEQNRTEQIPPRNNFTS